MDLLTRPVLLLLTSLFLADSPCVVGEGAGATTIPTGTRVILEFPDEILFKNRDYDVGDRVPARVDRDVVVDGIVVISQGAAAAVAISAITGRKIFGRKGKVSLRPDYAEAVDGQRVNLHGSLNKDGKSRRGVAGGVGALVFAPALFLTGNSAKVEAGSTMESEVDGTHHVVVQSPGE